MFIPDPRWEEPNLLIPGKKPTGPVVVDWSHPIGRNVRFSTIFQKPVVHDLLGNSLMNHVGAQFGRDSEDSYIKFDTYAGADYAEIPAFDCSNWRGVTVIAYFRFGYSPTATYPSIVASVNSGGYFANFHINTSVQPSSKAINWYAGNDATSTTIGTSSPSQDSLCFIVGTYDLTTQTIHGWIDGNYETASTSKSTAFASGPQAENYIGYISRSGGRSQTKPIFHVTILDRGVTPDEALSLYHNPYQFLIPA